MNIGTIIKSKRQKRDLTQEQLAEYLNVSVSAVSQWESGKTTPDFSLIVPIAEFFEITADELLGRTPGEKEKAIAEYNERTIELSNKGRIDECIELWREALRRFPGDFHSMSMLAFSLSLSIDRFGAEKAQAKEKECIDLCERILRDCTDSEIRSGAIQKLVFRYSSPSGSFADEKKAVEYACMANSAVVSREKLLEHAYYTEESREKRIETIHENRLSCMEGLTISLVYNDGSLAALEAALKLWETLIPDGNYLFYHCRIAYIYSCIACKYAERILKKETLDAMEKALEQARTSDTLPKRRQHYTSSFVSAASSDPSKTSKNYTETETQLVLRRMEFGGEFDFLREDPDFIALIGRYAKE